MTKKKTFVDPRYARTSHYQAAMKEIVTQKVCPLCPQTMKWHTNPILKRAGFWLITKSFQPYKNTAHHFLIIGSVHKENFAQLDANDWKDIATLSNWAIKKFNIPGGGLALRFGESLYTGATVSHLHLHLIVPEVKKGKAKPVYFPIG